MRPPRQQGRLRSKQPLSSQIGPAGHSGDQSTVTANQTLGSVPQEAVHPSGKRVGEEVKPLRLVGSIRQQQHCRLRGCRTAAVRDQFGNACVRLVSNGSDDRYAGKVNGFGHAQLVECLKVLGSATASSQDDRFDAILAGRCIRRRNRSGNPLGGPRSLHRHINEHQLARGPSAGPGCEHIKQRRAGAAGQHRDAAGIPWKQLLGFRSKPAQPPQFFAASAKRRLLIALPGQLNGAHSKLGPSLRRPVHHGAGNLDGIADRRLMPDPAGIGCPAHALHE